MPYAVEELPSLGLDLDTPGDVVALTRALDERAKRAPNRQGARQRRLAISSRRASCSGSMSELQVIAPECPRSRREWPSAS